ncbi:hypothetical protein V2J09_024015 [Rumex salicifolius]
MKVSVFAALLVLFTVLELGFCCEVGIKTTEGMDMDGTHNCYGSHNSAEIESLARFAVEEHNRLENGLLEFARVLDVQEQVVAGKLYHLILEAADAGKKKMYQAKIWVKPWMNFKQLQEFKHATNVSPFSTSDLGMIPGKKIN